jgi:hypothetical protein
MVIAQCGAEEAANQPREKRPDQKKQSTEQQSTGNLAWIE